MSLQLDSNVLIERRIGTIAYTNQILEQNPAIIQKIYAKIIPIRIEFDYFNETFIVQAVSTEFDEVSLGEVTPRYDVEIEIQRRKNGIEATYIHFKRENK